MDPVTGLVVNQAIQGVRSLLTDSEDTPQESSSSNTSDFEGFLRAHLSPNGENSVDEEALYSALAGERIKELKGEEGLKAYQEALESAKNNVRRADGYVSVETATNNALSSLKESGVLTKEEYSEVKGTAFKAAQLDDNHAALYDGRGGAGDATIATMDMESALAKAKAVIEQIKNGEVDTALPSESESSETVSPSGTSIDGDKEGFVFKPESESDGNLVILLPAKYSENVSTLVLKDAEGNLLEEGRATGLGNADSHGEREHFRFSKSGGGYGENITVQLTLKDGTVVDYLIPNPSERHD